MKKPVSKFAFQIQPAALHRGVTRHHQHGRWEARIGRVLGNRYLYLVGAVQVDFSCDPQLYTARFNP
jgi:hypothetical protein